MDVFFHGLSGGLPFLFQKRKTYLSAIGFGMFPDLASFGIIFPFHLAEHGLGKPELHQIPEFVSILYQLTHSLLIFGACFLITWCIRKKPYLPMLAWLLHILVDIPTHSKAFFPTPFLFPVSSYSFDGLPWGQSSIWGILWGILIALYVGYWLYHRKKKENR